LTVLFYAAGAPLVLLALIFISLTASIALQQLEQETTTLRGRGVTLTQVFGLNLVESVVMILLALPFALLVGWLAAMAMGHTTLFLQFTRPSDLVFSLQDINLLWLGGVALAILIARFLPLLGLRHTTTVSLKQERRAAPGGPCGSGSSWISLLIPAGLPTGLHNQRSNRLQTPAPRPAQIPARSSSTR
jgi:hypothetical protein